MIASPSFRTALRHGLWFAATLLALLAPLAGPAGADQRVSPSWMTVDAATKTVHFDVIAGWNANNGVLNFNGYFNGGMTVVVPKGWKVKVDFTNNDGDLPHSLLVTRPYAQDEMPEVAGHREVAIPRAYTRAPETGILANETDSFHFKAKKPGRYYWFCGAPGHGLGGMWTWFEVSETAETPYVLIAEGVPEGRP